MDPLLFALFLVACCGAGATGGLFPTGTWYEELEKPSWTPPNWVFPLAWTTLYLLMAFAAARVAPLEGSQYAMAFWAAQIAVNALWTPVFFGLRRIKAAIPVMGCLWLLVAGAMVTHWQLDMLAGLALLPYLIWVTVAGALNVQMWRLNPRVRPIITSEL